MIFIFLNTLFVYLYTLSLQSLSSVDVVCEGQEVATEPENCWSSCPSSSSAAASPPLSCLEGWNKKLKDTFEETDGRMYRDTDQVMDTDHAFVSRQ